MSEAFKCDKCGGLHEGSARGTVSFGRMPREEFGGELCEPCAQSLAEWFGTEIE